MNQIEARYRKTIERFANSLPKFPNGHIDYSNSDVAPVVTIFVKFKSKILLLKRSDRVRAHRSVWNTVTGYLDEVRPLREKVLEELEEELAVTEAQIASIRFGEPYNVMEEDINKTWIIHPVLVELISRPDIKLDWEHTEYEWIRPSDIDNYDIVYQLDESLRRALVARD